MNPSPFTRLNAATIRAERRNAWRAALALATAATLALAVLMLAHMALQLALALPDILSQSAARAAW